VPATVGFGLAERLDPARPRYMKRYKPLHMHTRRRA
jgi:hypothetical protein